MKWIINNYKDNFVEESYLNKLSKKNYKNIKKPMKSFMKK